MLPDWPHNNKGYCLIDHQLAQWRPPRCFTGLVNSNLPSGKSLVLDERIKTNFGFVFSEAPAINVWL